MLDRFAPTLRWIDAQADAMADQVRAMARINSGSYHVAGLDACAHAIARAAGTIGDLQVEPLAPHRQIDSAGGQIERPLGQLIRAARRPQARLQVLLCIHYDTVYDADDPFQTVTEVTPGVVRGPGVTDAKGGLVVMLTALEALERSPFAEGIGWEMIINPDEEIGSPGSAPLLAEAAARHDLGLLFEPSLPDGSLVSARKGSGNFIFVVRGKAAHAGRNPDDGRNAIHALGSVITAVAAMHRSMPGITTNVGQITGGGAVNVVPDMAIARCNIRVSSAVERQHVEAVLRCVVEQVSARDGFHAELHGDFHAPPKETDGPTLQLLSHLADCGREIGLDLAWKSTGGACDGNKLAAAGLPNVDSLGVRGGAIHSDQEYLHLDSLVERAKLSALLLMRLAAGDIPWPHRARRPAATGKGLTCS